MTSLSHRDRLWIVVCLSLGATAGLYFAYLDLSVFLFQDLSRDQVFGRDFAAFWTAAHLTVAGRAAEVFDPDAFATALRAAMGAEVGFNPYPYPPHGLFLVLPAGLLPYIWSYGLWMLGLSICYLIAARHLVPGHTAWMLALAPATIVTIAMGQNGLLTGALMLGGFAALPRRPVLAGVLFGLLTFKPQLGLLIPFALLAGGHWRTIAAAAVTTLVLLVGSLGLVGIDGWAAYATRVLEEQGHFLSTGTGAFMQMAPSPFMAVRVLGFEAGLGYAVQALSAVAAIAATLWSWHHDVPQDLRLAVLLVGTFLVSPYVFNYDMTVVGAAVLIMASRGVRGGFLPGERAILAAAWFIPVVMMYLHAVAPVAPLAVIALFALIVRRVTRFAPIPRVAPAE